jgi:glycolate oxidase iron-sulfur subunit
MSQPASHLQTLADRCVKCGLCAPVCPTYQQEQHEAASPRGRIALWQGLSSGAILWSERAQGHLDGCLSCRACESICPAKVSFGELMDTGRQWQRQQGQVKEARWLPRLRRLLEAKSWRWLLKLGAWLLQKPLRLPAQRLAWKASVSSDPTVLLWAGCTGEWLDQASLRAAILLLERLGERPQVLNDCCGALAIHAGETPPALPTLPPLPLLVLASGCALGLQDRGVVIHNPDTYFLQHPRWRELRFQPLAKTVFLHTPCSQQFLKQSSRALLRCIPDLRLKSGDNACCGAAGSHYLSHPESSHALKQQKLAQAEGCDLRISANIGCNLHLGAIHPWQLLAQQLLPVKTPLPPTGHPDE